MRFVCLAAADADAGDTTKDIPDINLGKFMSKFSSSPEPSSTFSLVTNDRLHGNGTKLLKGRIRLGIRKIFFIVRVVKDWNRLLREVVDAAWLPVFNRHLQNALNNKL